MNSSNDPLDKLLQQRFQQLFADEQAVVDDALKQRIWHRLPPAPQRTYRPVKRALLGLLLVGVGTGFYYGWQPAETAEKPLPAPTYASGSPVAHRSVSTGRVERPGSGTITENDLIETRPSDTLSHIDPIPNQVAARSFRPSLTRLTTNPFVTARTQPPETVPVVISRYNVREQPDLQMGSGHQEMPSQARRSGALSSRFVADANQLGGMAQSIHRADSLAGPLPLVPQNDSATNELVTSWAVLPVSSHSDYSVPGSLWDRLQQRVVFLHPAATVAKSAVSQRVPAANWFFTAAPLSTYQRMKIVAQTNTYVQDVASPAPWSAQTWGYQLSGGIRWLGWDAAVTYEQLRRWAYYERATDVYQVEPTAPGAYQVKRRTEAVGENVAVSLLGLRLDRQYAWGRHDRYYAQAGAQLSYLLSTPQPLGWLQASWGLALPLSNGYQLQLGPAIAYSLSDIWSSDRQLQIQPYTVGLSLTIRP